MFFKAPLLFKACLGCALLIHLVYCGEKNEDWDHHEIMDDDGMYHLYWSIEEKEIKIQLEVATKGWVGLGIWSGLGTYTKKGILDDGVIGWVDGNKPYLFDIYTVTDNDLFVDKQQDWKLLSGRENKTHTVLKFSRRLETCDEKDLPITDSSQHLVFTFYPKDPDSIKTVNYRRSEWEHTHVKLMNPRVKEQQMPKSVSYWDVRADNFTLPATGAIHYCRIVRGPYLKKKHHIIKIEPIIRPGYMESLHSIALRKCAPLNRKEAEKAVEYGGTPCEAKSAPRDLFSRCVTVYAVWGTGGESFIYPKHTGTPLDDDTEYFMLRIRYINPIFRKGLVVDDGFRVYHTPELRANDAGLFSFNSMVDPPLTAVLPPGEKNFILPVHVPPRCLAQVMPKQGINVFAVFFHMHERGRRIRIRHFRNNKELPFIAVDMQFGDHYEEYIYLQKDIKVLPGDQLTLECSYDTRGETSTNFQEMCNSVIYYYPPLSVAYGGSFPSAELLAGLTGMNFTALNFTYDPVNTKAVDMFIDYLKDYNWPDSNRCTFENSVRYSPHRSDCVTTDAEDIKVPLITYPLNLKEYRPPDECKSKTKQSLEDDMMSSSCKYYDEYM